MCENDDLYMVKGSLLFLHASQSFDSFWTALYLPFEFSHVVSYLWFLAINRQWDTFAYQLFFLEHKKLHNHTDSGWKNKWIEAVTEYSFAQSRKSLKHSDKVWRCHQITRLRIFDCRVNGPLVSWETRNS